jgi:hypothetical protein
MRRQLNRSRGFCARMELKKFAKGSFSNAFPLCAPGVLAVKFIA